jgi:threonine dehydrogenase-like Zn-dependent dehydrogenase
MAEAGPWRGQDPRRCYADQPDRDSTALWTTAVHFPLDLPYTLGWDVAGTIVDVGGDLQALAVGDRVIIL